MKIKFTHIKTHFSCWFFLALSGCGGGGTNNDEQVVTAPPQDSTVPLVEILYPSSNVIVDSTSIYIRGTATDDMNAISSLKVNGLNVDSIDGFATWDIKVPLERGEIILDVDVIDAAGNRDNKAARIHIVNELTMIAPSSMSIDRTNGSVLVIDDRLRTIFSADLVTGQRKKFMVSETAAMNLGFTNPEVVSVDNANNRAIVQIRNNDALFGIDLDSGELNLLADGDTIVDPSFGTKATIDLAIDETRNTVLLLQRDFKFPFGFGSSLNIIDPADSILPNPNAVIEVNLATGAGRVLSNVATADSEVFLRRPSGIVIDTTSDTAYILEENYRDQGEFAIFALNLETDEMSVFSDNTRPDDVNPILTGSLKLSIDRLGNRLLVGNSGHVFGISLNTGARSLVSDKPSALSSPSGLIARIGPDKNRYVFDDINNQLLMTKELSSEIEVLTLNSGERTRFSSVARLPNAEFGFNGSSKIGVDIVHNRAFVLTLDFNKITILSIDLLTGSRTAFTTLAPGKGANFSAGVAVDSTGNRAYILRSVLIEGVEPSAQITEHQLVEIDLNTGNENQVFTLDFAGDTAALRSSGDIAIDGDRIFVLGQQQIIALDLQTGLSRLFYQRPDRGANRNTFPGFSSNFDFASIVIDEDNSRLLLFESSTSEIVALSLETELDTVLSPSIDAINSSFAFNRDIAIDKTRNKAYTIEKSGIVEVDLQSGQRTTLSSIGIPDENTLFYGPSGLAVDAKANRLLVLDNVLNALFAIDIETGQRSIISK